MEIANPGQWIENTDPYVFKGRHELIGCGVTGKTAVIVVAGQSLNVNGVDSRYTPKQAGNRQMNIYDGKCYTTREPMLGTNGTGGTWMARFADNLIEAGKFDRVILVPMAVGNTNVSQWADTKNPPFLGRNIGIVGKRLKNARLTCTAVFYGQGESDTRDDTTKDAYLASLQEVVSLFNQAMPGCPVLVARESYIYGKFGPQIQQAQAAAVNGTTIFAGEDSDSISPAGRYDNTHLNSIGAEQRAQMAVNALIAVPKLRLN